MKLPHGLRRRDALRLTGAVFQNDKGRFPEHAQPVHPAPQANLLVDEFGERLNQRTLLNCGQHRKNLAISFCWSHKLRRCHPASGQAAGACLISRY
jgi:hypothetical protein